MLQIGKLTNQTKCLILNIRSCGEEEEEGNDEEESSNGNGEEEGGASIHVKCL